MTHPRVAARRILQLINSRPRTPTEDEIAAIIEGVFTGWTPPILHIDHDDGCGSAIDAWFKSRTNP
jgi:hypothetical protein